MLWAYYSSQIVLYGAEFTRLFALRYGAEILPSENAVRVLTRTVESRRPHFFRRNTRDPKIHR
jgi:membrane protein